MFRLIVIPKNSSYNRRGVTHATVCRIDNTLLGLHSGKYQNVFHCLLSKEMNQKQVAEVYKICEQKEVRLQKF